MTKDRIRILAMTLVLMAVCGSAMAHHAANQYEKEKRITLTGTVTQYEFINPHTRIHLTVKDEQGNTATWVAESYPPQRLYRAGWRTDTLKPGDHITITGLPMKDGSKAMSILYVVGPSGKQLEIEAPQ